MSKMPLKIILVMIGPPNPFGGAASRWFYVLLKELCARGHQVEALAACPDMQEQEKVLQLFPQNNYRLHLYPYPKRSKLYSKLKTLLRPYSYMFSDELQEHLKRLLQQDFDVLHLEQLWCGNLGNKYRDRCLLNVHHLMSIDQEFISPQGLRQRFDRWLIFQTEKKLLKQYPYIRACSQRLEEKIKHIHSNSVTQFIPVGIDASLYRYIPDEERTSAPLIVVIGTMTWYPTYSAAVRVIEKLFPKIREKIPQAKLMIVGRHARDVLSSYLGREQIEIVENVPEIYPYFAQASVLLYPPSRGSGMKIKILEAFLYGTPVATTWEGVEGIPAEAGVHALIAESDHDLIEHTVQLLQNPEQQNRLRRAARELVEFYCGPEYTVSKIEQFYQQMKGEKLCHVG